MLTRPTQDMPPCVLEENPPCLLEENPPCLLEENPPCVLEDNPEVGPVDDDDGVLLEANDEGADTDEDEVEVPYMPGRPPDETHVIDVARPIGGALGLVLDETNTVVALREGSPAERCARFVLGDVVVGVNGVPVGADLRVGALLRSLPPSPTCSVEVRRAAVPRALPAKAQVEGQLEAQRAARAEIERRAEDADPPPARPPVAGMAEAVSDDLPAHTRAGLQAKWERHARAPLGRRINAAALMRMEGNDKFSEGQFKQARRASPSSHGLKATLSSGDGRDLVCDLMLGGGGW